jgi:hypothetical protein
VRSYFPNEPLKRLLAKKLGGHKVELFITSFYKSVPVGTAPTSPGPSARLVPIND